MGIDISQQLLKIGAVHLRPNDPFTWTSGIKSPIYCDNRLTMSFPILRQQIAIELEKLVRTYFSDAELVAGTATAGIAHAAWLSDRLHLPMVYVRSSAKAHGKGNQIEGVIHRGQKVVIVEDLISTGGSVLTTAEALQHAGVEVVGVVAIFTYGLRKAEQQLKDAGIKCETVTNFKTLINVASKEGYITNSDIEKLENWLRDPIRWANH